MSQIEEDPEREDRILMEAIVDAYGPEEQAMGWFYYLQDRLAFPFRARCNAARTTSPLQVGETVRVTGMAPEDDCLHEMIVMVSWEGRSLGVPLVQLDAVHAGEATHEALGDWHYWVARGYQLG